MSADYEEIRVIFPTSTVQTHPAIQSALDSLDPENDTVEFLQAQAGALTMVLWSDTSIDRPDLLDTLEHEKVPYDAYYRYHNGASCPEVAWYRPYATPNHDRYLTDFDDDPIIPWSTLTDLAQDSVGLTLSRIRAVAHLPPTTILDTCSQHPMTSARPAVAIPYRTIAAQYLEEIIRECRRRESIRNAFPKLPHAGDDAYTLASRLEDLANSTVIVFAQQAALPPSVQRTIQKAGAIAQPFDDGYARLVIYTPTKVLHTMVWPTRVLRTEVLSTVRRLAGWRDIVETIWNALEQFVQHSRTTS